MPAQFRIDLIRHLPGGSSLLGRVGKAAKPFKRFFPDKIAELLELLLCFPRQARDQGGADADPGNLFPKFFEQRADQRRIAPAVHSPEQTVVDMLKRQVDIFDDLRFGGNGLDQLVGGAVGVAVEKTHPADFFNFTELAQQLGQHELSVEVLPIAGGVLCDDVQLDHTPVGKAAGFFKDLFHRHAAEMPPNVRNCAEGAAVCHSPQPP